MSENTITGNIQPSTSRKDKEAHCAPEEVFLKNAPVISPADMSYCILSRTSAMVNCVIQSLSSTDYGPDFCPDRASSVLSQVECNLKELEVIVNLWHQAEKKQCADQPLLSLHLDTIELESSS